MSISSSFGSHALVLYSPSPCACHVWYLHYMKAAQGNLDLVKTIHWYLGKKEIVGFSLLKFLDEIIGGHRVFL